LIVGGSSKTLKTPRMGRRRSKSSSAILLTSFGIVGSSAVYGGGREAFLSLRSLKMLIMFS
jgi:hypothetical protein